MIPSFLRRKLPSLLNEIPELRLASLKLAAWIVGSYPIGDFILGLEHCSFIHQQLQLHTYPSLYHFSDERTIFAMLLEKNALDVAFEVRSSFKKCVNVLESIK